MSILRLRRQGLVWTIILLITWFGTCETDEWVGLWREEGGADLRQVERRLLLADDEMLRLLQMVEGIAESHVVVADIEGHSHRLLLGIEISHIELVGMIIHMRNLGGAEVIALLHLRLLLALVSQALAEVAHIGEQTELRFLHHSLASVVDGVIEFAVTVFHHDIQLTVRRAHGILFGVCTDASHQCQSHT